MVEELSCQNSEPEAEQDCKAMLADCRSDRTARIDDTYCSSRRGKSVAGHLKRVLWEYRQNDIEESTEAKVEKSEATGKQGDWANSNHELSIECQGFNRSIKSVFFDKASLWFTTSVIAIFGRTLEP